MKALNKRSAFAHSHRSRGTVIMLVVAIMTLLMIIGTVFILTTRSDRAGARQTAEAFNFDLARNSAIDVIRDRLFMQTTFPTPSAPNMMAAPYVKGDILVRPVYWNGNTNYALNDLVMGADGRLYRCTFAHMSSLTDDQLVANNSAAPAVANTSGGKWTPNVTANSVSSGYAEFRDVPAAAGWGSIPAFANSTLNGGFASNTYLSTDLILATGGDMGIIYPRRYNPGTAAYDIGYAATPPTGSEISVVYADLPNNVLSNDGIWHLLTYSSGVTRYRFSFRAIDTNRMLNLNVGDYRVPTPATVDRNGTFLTGYQLANQGGGAFNTSDNGNAARLHSGASATLRGRNGTSTSFDFTSWEGQCLGFEKWGANSYASTSGSCEWFDFSDELELRAFGSWGTPYVPRCTGNATTTGQIWYNTLKSATAGSPPTPNPNRNYYTTYSFDRNIGPVVNPRYRLTTIAGQMYNWPGGSNSNRMVNLKAKTTGPDEIARNAIYFANALAAAGFSDDECMQAAVNYAGQAVQQIGGVNIIEEYPAPPVIAAGSGLILLQNVSSAYTYQIINNGTGLPPTKTYLAYYAQPYLNEVAVARNPPVSDPTEAVVDFFVEIVNPHLADINLKKWRIKVGNNVWIPDVGGELIGLPTLTIPSHTYKTFCTTGTSFTTCDRTVPAVFEPANETITLERPYFIDGTGIPQYMVVDKIVMNFPAPGAYNPTDMTTSPRVFDMQRNNKTSGAATPTSAASGHDWWMCTSPVKYSTGATSVADGGGAAGDFVASMAPTIGALNDVQGDATRFGIEMLDRFAYSNTPVVGTDMKLMRENVGDLCGYMLIGNRSDIPLTDQMISTSLNKSIDNSNASKFCQEMKARLHFLRDPRAQSLLNHLAAVDRASDNTDQIGAGSNDDVSETRIPGRININTAPLQVLRAVFDSYYTSSAGVVDTATSINVCNAIIAYRSRTNVGGYNFSSQPWKDTGLGFKNFAEVIFPIMLGEGRLQLAGTDFNILATTPSTTTPTSLDSLYSPVFYRRPSADGSRSASSDYPTGLGAGTWAKLFTVATVRSDTFCIYGYVEAIRPVSSATHNNAGDWYAPTTETGGTANIRVGFRRFVALIDRSWNNVPKSNSTYQMPRIIGVRELPK